MFRQKTPGEVDHALKILFRQVAPAVFRLVGAPVSAERIRPTDVTVNLPAPKMSLAAGRCTWNTSGSRIGVCWKGGS